MIKQGNVLIVDDEYIIAIDIKQRLESMGFSVCGIVNSGEKAVEQCRTNRPSIVLMDIIIKGKMDGIETSREIEKSFDIPIIFISASSDAVTLKKIMSKGIHGYIHKPITDIDLKYTIEQSIRMHEVTGKLKKIEQLANDLMTINKKSIACSLCPSFILEENGKISTKSGFFKNFDGNTVEALLQRIDLSADDQAAILCAIKSGPQTANSIPLSRKRACMLVPMGNELLFQMKDCEHLI